jgi:hypothetical protein
VGLFHHDQSAEHECLGHLRLESGADWVGLIFEARDHQPHEVAVFRSEVGFPDGSLAPASDLRQTLVYRGTDMHSRVKDDGLAGGVHYFYSVFAGGLDGQWHLQLKADVTLGRHHSGREADFDTTATERVRCPHCYGTGSPRAPRNLIPLPCPICHGKGWVRVKRDPEELQDTLSKATAAASEARGATPESPGEVPVGEQRTPESRDALNAPTAPTAPKGMGD